MSGYKPILLFIRLKKIGLPGEYGFQLSDILIRPKVNWIQYEFLAFHPDIFGITLQPVSVIQFQS
jgi:hypothetical protein